MKKHLYLLLVLFVFAASSLSSIAYTIGTGTSTWNYPFYNYWTNSRTQTIYLASELTAAGMTSGAVISGIKWDITTAPGQYDSLFCVRMGHTALSSFANSSYVATGLTDVYNEYADFTGLAGWNGVDFTTTFTWDGTSNIIVDVMFYNGEDNYSSSGYVHNTSATSRSITWYSDDPINPCADPSTPATGTISSYMPNIQLIQNVVGEPTAPTTPSPANGATGVALTGNLGWTWGANNVSYDLWFGPTGSETQIVDGQECSGFVGSHSYTCSNPMANYSWWITAYNGSGIGISSPHWNFTTAPLPNQVVIGTGTVANMNLPAEPYWNYSMSQVIYPQSLINAPDNAITNIAYYYNGYGAWTEDEVIVYMGHTTQDTLSTWLPLSNFTQVYLGSWSLPAVAGWVSIPLDAPFAYNNTDNLVVMMEWNTGTCTPSGSYDFFCTANDHNMGICYYSDGTNPDPAAPPAGNLRKYIPDTVLTFTHVELGAAQGHVYVYGTTNPLEGATVTLNPGAYSTTTGADGFYSFPSMPSGTYDLTCSCPLYLDQTIEDVVVSVGSTTTTDAYLTWSELSVDVSSFDVSMYDGGTVAETMTITNNGTGALEYSISAMPAVARSSNIVIPPVSLDYPRGTDPLSTGLAPASDVPNCTQTRSFYNVLTWNAHTDYFIEFDVEDPTTFSNYLYNSYSLFAGDWSPTDPNIFYALDYNYNYLFELDYSADTITNIGTVAPDSVAWLGMSADPFTGILYATNGSQLYTIDPSVPSATAIGLIGLGRVIDMAFGSDGVLYGNEFENDQLISIDTTTGAGTAIGSTGFDANYAQGMFNDWESGQMYMLAYENGVGPQLRAVDTTTGATTIIGSLPGECCAGGVPPLQYVNVTPYEGTVAAGGSQLINLTFSAENLNPGESFAGDLVITNNSNYTESRGDDYLIPFTVTVLAFPAPENTHIAMSGANAVLTWNAVAGAAQYHVYYATDPNGTWSLLGSTSTNTYTHTGAGTSATKYYYKVTADTSAR